ncbi:hypothetical protein GN956_G17325 [Arapaima gigas]
MTLRDSQTRGGIIPPAPPRPTAHVRRLFVDEMEDFNANPDSCVTCSLFFLLLLPSTFRSPQKNGGSIKAAAHKALLDQKLQQKRRAAGHRTPSQVRLQWGAQPDLNPPLSTVVLHGNIKVLHTC